METYTFTVTLDHAPSDEEQDALYEAGLADAAIEVENGNGLLHVDREAPSLDAAILSVVHDATRAGFQVTGVQQEDLVSLKTIAGRVGRSYEGVRLLAAGKRGPGGFPQPFSGDGWSLYSWAATSDWFRKNFDLGDVVDDYERTIAVADLMARAALIARGSSRRYGSFFLGIDLAGADDDYIGPDDGWDLPRSN